MEWYGLGMVGRAWECLMLRSAWEQVGLLVVEPVCREFAHTAFGENRNLEESGGIWCKYRNSCPAGIPVKNSFKKEKKQEFLATSPKTRSCEKFLMENAGKKEILRIPVRNVFWVQKINSCKQEYAT